MGWLDGTGPWPEDAAALVAEQVRLAAEQPPPWSPGPDTLVVAAAFAAFPRDTHGPGTRGDEAWVGAVLARGGRAVAGRVTRAEAGAAYEPGLLALRQGPMLAAAIGGLPARPDLVLIDATGRDHPRGAGLALHLGAVLDLPSVGVTLRPLQARGGQPGRARGDSSPLLLGDVEVARWVRTTLHARPVVAHAAWRTDPEVATTVVLRCSLGVRTPAPLRDARRLARAARAHATTS